MSVLVRVPGSCRSKTPGSCRFCSRFVSVQETRGSCRFCSVSAAPLGPRDPGSCWSRSLFPVRVGPRASLADVGLRDSWLVPVPLRVPFPAPPLAAPLPAVPGALRGRSGPEGPGVSGKFWRVRRVPVCPAGPGVSGRSRMAGQGLPGPGAPRELPAGRCPLSAFPLAGFCTGSK